MALISNCFDEMYLCYENILECFVTLVILLCMIVGLKIITSDLNETLVRMDKLIYSIATF